MLEPEEGGDGPARAAGTVATAGAPVQPPHNQVLAMLQDTSPRAPAHAAGPHNAGIREWSLENPDAAAEKLAILEAESKMERDGKAR